MIRRCWLALMALLLASEPAAAEAPADCPRPPTDPQRSRAEAKRLFERALRLEPSAPARALTTLRCAETMASRAAISLRIGTIAERLTRYEEAADAFERYLEMAGAHAPDREAMQQRIRKLRARVKAQQAQRAAAPATPPSAEASGSTQSTIGWVAGGTGVAFAIAGVALLSAAKAHSDSVHALEPGTVAWTSDEARGTIEQAEIEQAVGIAGLAVGGGLVALGASLIATADGDDSSTPDAAVLVGTSPRGASGTLRVRF